MRKYIIFIACICMLCLSHFAYSEASKEVSGVWGNIIWNIKNGVLTISGDGPMPDEDEDPTGQWHNSSISPQITSVIVEDGVSTIGSYAFAYCENVESILIPQNITAIKEGAFAGTKIRQFSIPASVASLGPRLFLNCQELYSVHIPDRATTIPEEFLSGCVSLQSVSIPTNVTAIEAGAFSWCSFAEITIPSSVTSIGNNAFRNCQNLESISFPGSIISIGEHAFLRCPKLSTVLLPASVKQVGAGAFAGCTSLQSILVDSGNSNYTSLNGVLYSSDMRILSQYPAGRPDTTYEIPAGVLMVKQDAFMECPNIQQVTLPSGLTTLETWAFRMCRTLEIISLPSSIVSIGDGAFHRCEKLTYVYYEGEESDRALISIGSNNSYLLDANWIYCEPGTSDIISLPLGLHTVEAYAFSGTSAQVYVIPEGVTSIGPNAFSNLIRVDTIYLPDSLTDIADTAFSGCEDVIFFCPNTTCKAYQLVSMMGFNVKVK